MGLVSARLDDADEAILKAAKVNMSELLRKAAHEEARKLQRLDALRTLGRLAVKPARTRSEDLVREDRDAH